MNASFKKRTFFIAWTFYSYVSNKSGTTFIKFAKIIQNVFIKCPFIDVYLKLWISKGKCA